MTEPAETIAHLSAGDLAQAGGVLDAAFGRGGMVANLRLAFALQPENWLCSRRDGEIIAVVGAYIYGPVASIGMMAVHPSTQRQGVGDRLLAELIGYLDDLGRPPLFLDASAAGQRLYPKLGFVAEGETLRMTRFEPLRDATEVAVRRHVRSEADPGYDRPAVSRMKDGDLEEVVAFDAPLFGASRAEVIAAFWTRDSERALVARDASGRITGYLISAANHIGPWTATSPRTAASLLQAALAQPFDSAPFLLAQPQTQRLCHCSRDTASVSPSACSTCAVAARVTRERQTVSTPRLA